MLKPYDLLESVLIDIEKGIRDGVNVDELAKKHSISGGYLRRFFKFSFEQTIGGYIRSRRLAVSLDDLLKTDANILDIALEYGFNYEQSYIEAFKREFGITPGDIRKARHIVRVKPPLNLYDENKLADGLFFGPDIVMVSQFHVVGVKQKIKYCGERASMIDCTKRFNEMKARIPNVINPNVLINISTEADKEDDCWYFMPSVQVKKFDNIPEEFECFTFPSSLCARFRFIKNKYDTSPNTLSAVNEQFTHKTADGSVFTAETPEGHDANLNVLAVSGITRAINDSLEDRALISVQAADGMFKPINDFIDNNKQKYFLKRNKINISISDLEATENFFSYWEWLAPVREKAKEDVPKYSQGIIKTYKHGIPALRFIGKKYWEANLSYKAKAISYNLKTWCYHGLFDVIERQLLINQPDKEIKTLYEGADSYTGLVVNCGTEVFDYWIGMFMPEDTPVPQGYEKIDFPKSSLAVCRVYGKKNFIINYDTECRKRLADEGIELKEDLESKAVFFQRFLWRDFFKEDEYGNRVLEYCYFIG